MLDTTPEAIEADLQIAEQRLGLAPVALVRAQIRTTLLAASYGAFRERHLIDATDTTFEDHQGRHEAAPAAPGPGDTTIVVNADHVTYTVPTGASWEDRVEAAAHLLNIDVPLLALRLSPTTVDDAAVVQAIDIDEVAAPDEDELAADFGPAAPPAEEDVFAEAKKVRGRKK